MGQVTTKREEVLDWLKQQASEFSYSSSQTSGEGGKLVVSFGKEQYTIPFAVVDIGVEAVKSHLEAALIDDWRSRAEYHEHVAATIRKTILKGVNWC